MSSAIGHISDSVTAQIFRQMYNESLAGISIPPMSVMRAREEIQQQPIAEEFFWLG